MKHLLLLTLLATTPAWAGLKLVPSASPITKDPFSSYQWALKNQGQIEVEDITDYQSLEIAGTPGADLGWAPVDESLVKRDSVVAVIDSGLDLDHEEFKGALALNQAECNDGRVPTPPKEDKDGNGFVADCMGWDFTATKAGLMQRPYDDIGHGTHLAGIIAARSDNGVGISGISNHIKILPLRVEAASESDQDPFSQQSQEKTTDRVEKAMRYAILRKVDVINLSQGWAIRYDSQSLRKVFADAIASGIVIVAAAGNNSTSAPNYPCSYEGVICVAGTNAQGQLSYTTNYGGYVDFAAPGDEILSTFPTKLDSFAFGIKGYNYLSGSSQATAYISGLVALLKALHPDENFRQLYARLAASSRELGFSDKFTLHGTPNFARLEAPSSPLVQPSFKDQDKILFQSNSPQSFYKLKVQNFSDKALKLVGIKVRTLQGPVEMFYDTITDLPAGGDRVLQIPFKVLRADQDNQVNLSVAISVAGGTKTFKHSLILVRELSDADSVRHMPIPGFSNEDLSSTYKDRVIPKLHSIADPLLRLNEPEYFTSEIKNGDLLLTLFQVKDESLQVAQKFTLKGTDNFLQLLLTSAPNGDPAYILYTLHTDANKQRYLQLTHLDANLQPRFGQNSYWKYLPESVVARPAAFIYIAKDVPGFGRIPLPVQIDSGAPASASQSKDPLVQKQGNTANRIFYLEPQLTKDGVSLITKNLDTSAWQDQLRAQLGLTWRDHFAPLQFYPQSKDDSQNGRAQLILSLGREAQTKYYRLDLSQLDGAPGKPQLLQNFNGASALFSPHFSVGQKLSLAESPVAAQRFPGSRLHWFALNGQDLKAQDQRLELPDAREEIQALLAAYHFNDEEHVYILTSQAALEQVVRSDGQSSLRRLPVARFSFIPPLFINKIYFPTFGGDATNSFPAFYADTSSIYSDYVFVLSAKNGALSAPANLSIKIPAGCAAMNPAVSGANHRSLMVFFCAGASGPELRQIPIE